MRIRVNPKSSGPTKPRSAEAPTVEPETSALKSDFGGYLFSLPERVLRSTAAVSAGLLRELSGLALPESVRRTKLYDNLVEATLRFLIEDVGGVEGAYPAETRLAKDFALRRTTGNGIELLGILVFRASPVWVLAALADVTGAGRRLIPEIAAALKAEGLLAPGREFTSLDQILDGLEQTSGRLATAVNTPPLDVASLRRDLEDIRDQARRIPPSKLPSAETVVRQWRRLQEEAARQDRGVLALSTVMALAAIARLPEDLRWLSRSLRTAARRTGEVAAGALMEHYSSTLGEIRQQGFSTYWVNQFRPYLAAAARRFSRESPTLTERFLRGREGGGS